MIHRCSVALRVIGALLVGTALLSDRAPAAPPTGPQVGRVYLDDVLPAPEGAPAVELQLRTETADGGAAGTLRAGDLEVRDNGSLIDPRRTALAPLFEAGGGTACVIAIDASRTMKGEPFTRAVEGALHYLERMEDSDHLSVVTFADGVEVVFGFDVAREEARRRLEALSTADASRSTLLFDGLFRSVALLRDQPRLPRRRFAIAFSDGRDQGSTRDLAQVVVLANGGEEEPRVPVYAVGYARFGGAGLETLERLAEGTTARAFEASSTLDLAQLFDEIRRQMLGSYVLRYPAGLDGERHSIDVIFEGKQDTRNAVYPDGRKPGWPLVPGAVLFITAGAAALLYQRRRRARSVGAEGAGAPAIPEDRVIMP